METSSCSCSSSIPVGVDPGASSYRDQLGLLVRCVELRRISPFPAAVYLLVAVLAPPPTSILGLVVGVTGY